MILYIGNKLSRHGYTPTSVETLGDQLGEFARVVSVSSKRNKLLRVADMSWAILRYRRTINRVIIDTYSTSNFYFALLASQLCRLLHLPYIPILHGGNLPARLDRNPRLSKMIFEHSFVNVAPSGYLLYEFRRRGYARVTLIPNTIDIGAYPFTRRDVFAPRLLWVRAFDKTYNCQMAIRVLDLLLKRYPQAELCMVGPDKDGSMQQVIDQAEAMGIAAALKITGRLSRPDWHALSKSYDIFINTTNVDNTPVSVVEAMALGLVVVSTDVGGVPYLIENGRDGLCTPVSDVRAMADKIEWLLENPTQSAAMCRQARDKVETFDWSVVKESWKEVLR